MRSERYKNPKMILKKGLLVLNFQSCNLHQ
jgi:hypothetical protein